MPKATVEHTLATDRERLDALLAHADLRGHAEAIRSAARVAIELVPRPLGEELPFGASRLGGVPDFPAGDDDWPEAMSFLLEVNLAELAAVTREVALPRVGLLSFFVVDGFDDDGDYLATGLAQYDKKIPKAGVWRVSPPAGIRTGPCFAIDFVPRLTLPCPGTSELEALRIRGAAAKAYEALYAAWAHPRHQLLGCKNTDIDDDPDDALLLSLDTDKRLKWSWGDGNRLSFHLPKGALLKGKLDEAWPVYVDA